MDKKRTSSQTVKLNRIIVPAHLRIVPVSSDAPESPAPLRKTAANYTAAPSAAQFAKVAPKPAPPSNTLRKLAISACVLVLVSAGLWVNYAMQRAPGDSLAAPVPEIVDVVPTVAVVPVAPAAALSLLAPDASVRPVSRPLSERAAPVLPSVPPSVAFVAGLPAPRPLQGTGPRPPVADVGGGFAPRTPTRTGLAEVVLDPAPEAARPPAPVVLPRRSAPPRAETFDPGYVAAGTVSALRSRVDSVPTAPEARVFGFLRVLMATPRTERELSTMLTRAREAGTLAIPDGLLTETGGVDIQKILRAMEAR